jgi:nucleotide-binding universal stress UspA family protein
MSTTTDTSRSGTTPPQDRPERVVLVAGGDLAGYAAARWVARRAALHPIDVTLVATEQPGIDGGRAERAAEVLRDAVPGVQVRWPSSDADGGDGIVRAAEGCDLLVLGTDRVSPLRRHLPPTLTVRVAEAARCPVVLVPSDWQPGTGPVVAGVALDRSDEAALRFAVAEAASLRRELVLVHTWHLSDVVTPVFAFALDESPVRAEHAARLDELARRTREDAPSLQVTPALVHGEARRAMVERGEGADVVVVGSHGRSSIERVLLGSVGRALAERPPCPVAIVPPRYARVGRSGR